MNRLALLLFVCVSTLVATPACAHKTLMGAWLEGDVLVVEVGFGDGSSVDGAAVTVTDKATSQVVLRGETDESGLFEAPLPEAVLAAGNALQVTADAGSGHLAEAEIAADELPGVQESQDAEADPTSEAAAEDSGAAMVDEARLRKLVREETAAAMQQELRSLRREVAALSNAGPGATEIIGGIGYLLGLCGLAAILLRPKTQRRP